MGRSRGRRFKPFASGKKKGGVKKSYGPQGDPGGKGVVEREEKGKSIGMSPVVRLLDKRATPEGKTERNVGSSCGRECQKWGKKKGEGDTIWGLNAQCVSFAKEKDFPNASKSRTKKPGKKKKRGSLLRPWKEKKRN